MTRAMQRRGVGGRGLLEWGTWKLAQQTPKSGRGGLARWLGYCGVSMGESLPSARQVCFLLPEQKGVAVLIPLVRYSEKHRYRTPLC